jgi:hypothetical protein
VVRFWVPWLSLRSKSENPVTGGTPAVSELVAGARVVFAPLLFFRGHVDRMVIVAARPDGPVRTPDIVGRVWPGGFARRLRVGRVGHVRLSLKEALMSNAAPTVGFRTGRLKALPRLIKTAFAMSHQFLGTLASCTLLSKRR